MNEPGNDKDAASTPVAGVPPWQTLASLGITENDLAAAHHMPAAPVLRLLAGQGGAV
ncbi:hypothetical protein ABT301_25990 [Streptomyces sp. NPDC000987]|uniref:hypothetical protein n=1 Tax=Streptomyces sp. NPDC000987 TaxID=3154374 RepID=UPI0033315A33